MPWAEFASHDDLFRAADELLFGLAEDSVDSILQAYPDVGRRPGREKWAAEQCAIRCDQPEVMEQLGVESERYLAHFGFGFVMFVNGYTAPDVLATMSDRLHNDAETEPRSCATNWPGSTHPARAHAGPRGRLRQLVLSAQRRPG